MKGKILWLVVAVVVIAAAGFYFWPRISRAPASTDQQVGAASQNTVSLDRDPRMSGMWQSTTDAKFTREIRADGVMIDHYVGDTTPGIPGEWSVVDPSKEDAVKTKAQSFPGKTIIKVVWEGGSETTYFAVNFIDERSMTTTDLTGKGEVTTYTHLQ